MRVWGIGRIFAGCFFIFTLLFSGMTWGQGSAVSFRKIKFRHVAAYEVVVNLNSPNVNVSLSLPGSPLNNRTFPHASFKSIVYRTLPTAAINGTYYDTRTYRPVGLLVSQGKMVQAGGMGVAVCFDGENRVQFLKIRDWRNFPWESFNVVLSSGPTLVNGGKVSIFPHAEGFHDPEIFRSAKRSAIGLTRANKLLLVSVITPIRLRQMAVIMKKLGAYEAVNLDGGTSTGLYYRGRFLAHPSRTLTNVLAVYYGASEIHRGLPAVNERAKKTVRKGPNEKKKAVSLRE